MMLISFFLTRGILRFIQMTHVDDDYEANKRVADSLREYMGRRLNVMNAFDTPILEGLMAAVKVEPLQRIGTVLDASAKCYALRVDNTYSACYKVLSAASGETRVAPLQDENLQDDQTENEAENSNEDGGDKNRRSAANVDDREGSGDGDKQGKNKLLRPLDQSSKIKQLTQENRQLAEGLWKRFATSEQFGESEDDLWALFEQLSNDIVGTVMKRRVGAVQGSLERRDNQFSIEDAIYRKITKDFEEGSARSFVSNEVLMNDHGNFLILHTNWQGDEPFRPFPSLVNHLSAASTQCQTKAIDQMICAVNRAQTKRPSEYTLLTQICADDGQSLPTIDFHLREQCEQPIGFTADDDFDNGDDTGADQHGVIVADQNGALSLCQMEFDETITNPAFAGSAILPLTNGTTLAQGDLIDVIDETLGQQIEEEIEGGEIPNITKREGEAFGTEIAEREKQLAGGEEDICDEQIGRLIDENLLPPTQTGNENFVPLTNTLIEDASHWMGDHNLDGGLVSADQTRSKKGKAKRQLHEAGNAKATAKRRLQKRNDFEKLNGIADDMCWIPKRVVSPFVKSAIAEIQQNSLAKRRLEMEVDFSEDTPLPFLGRKLTRDRAKQLETMAYDPINLLKARVFYKSHLGVWSFFPCAVPLQRVRLIRRPHFLPPFSLPLPLNEQHNEFNKFYFEFITDSAAEENIGEENWQIDEEDGTFGDEVPVDAEFMCSPHAQSPMLDESPRRRKRDSEGTDDDELDTGFGFLNNITLSEIKQIYYQTNLNVAKVKKAMLKVLSSRKKYASVDEVEMEMADEDDDGSSCSSVNNDVELNYAEDVAGSSDDDTSSAEAGDVQGETAKSFGINSRDLFAKVPRFLSGITKRNLTVTNSFAVLLHLCNDKQFTLAQTKGTNKLVEGHSMSEFFVKF